MDFPASVTRRGFLKTTGAAGAAVALGQWPFARLNAGDAPKLTLAPPSWVDKPMRWAQLTVVEDDPTAHFSPASEHREADDIERSSHAR